MGRSIPQARPMGQAPGKRGVPGERPADDTAESTKSCLPRVPSGWRGRGKRETTNAARDTVARRHSRGYPPRERYFFQTHGGGGRRLRLAGAASPEAGRAGFARGARGARAGGAGASPGQGIVKPGTSSFATRRP